MPDNYWVAQTSPLMSASLRAAARRLGRIHEPQKYAPPANICLSPPRVMKWCGRGRSRQSGTQLLHLAKDLKGPAFEVGAAVHRHQKNKAWTRRTIGYTTQFISNNLGWAPASRKTRTLDDQRQRRSLCVTLGFPLSALR